MAQRNLEIQLERLIAQHFVLHAIRAVGPGHHDSEACHGLKFSMPQNTRAPQRRVIVLPYYGDKIEF